MRALLLVALAIGVGYAQPACYQIDLDLQVSVRGDETHSESESRLNACFFRVPTLTMGYRIWSQALPYVSNHARSLQDAPSGMNFINLYKKADPTAIYKYLGLG